MRLIGEPGFVLHARAWRETSLLVEVLTEGHGRIGLLARGVQGGKRHPLRAALQPLQAIRFDAVSRGELARLVAAEASDAGLRLTGDAALAAFYVNELTLQLAPRQVPQPELFDAYARVRHRLGSSDPLAWSLRRYERDLLDALGVGFEWHCDGDGQPIDPAARYRLDPEHGPRRQVVDRGHSDRQGTATGEALLALAADRPPQREGLASLRRPLREVLAHHLGPRRLRSWTLFEELGRVLRRSSAESQAGSRSAGA